MDNEVINIDNILPFGEKLKFFLNSPNITNADVKGILSSRGVFTSSSDKQSTIPILSSSIMGPNEFETIQAKNSDSEARKKFRSSSLNCIGSQPLSEVLKKDLLDNDDIVNSNLYSFTTSLAFDMNGVDDMSLNYTINRFDGTKNWASLNTEYRGSVSFSHEPSDNKIYIKSEFTSNETRDINDIIIKKVKNELVNQKYVSTNEEINRITSDSFTNEERCEFMLQLLNGTDDNQLTFETVDDVEIGPDPNISTSKEYTILAENVKKLIIHGDQLQEISYLKDKNYYKGLILREIQAKFKYNFNGLLGTCYIQYGFPHFFRSNVYTNEFQTSIINIYPHEKSKEASKAFTEQRVLELFEQIKKDKFDAIKNPRTENVL